jgi:hypothetical protein
MDGMGGGMAGRKTRENFRYSSETNTHWLSIDEIRQIIAGGN